MKTYCFIKKQAQNYKVEDVPNFYSMQKFAVTLSCAEEVKPN